MYVVGRLMTMVLRLVSPLICLWCGCAVARPGDMAAVSSIARAICPWGDCLIA
jgi:hypothetical protein